MDFVPRVEHTLADVGTQLVDIFLRHGLTTQVHPFAETFASHVIHDSLHVDFGMGLQVMHQSADSIIYNHVTVGMISLQWFENTHFTLAFFHVFAENLQRLYRFWFVVKEVFATVAEVIILVFIRIFTFFTKVGLGDPYLQQLASFDDFLDSIGSQRFKFNVLNLTLAFVAAYIFRSVASNGVHVIHPPIGRHDFKLVFRRVVVDQTERQHNIEFVGIVGLREQRE